MDRKLRVCLVFFAVIETLTLNGLLATHDLVSWVQGIFPAPRIYLVVLEAMGQYETLFFLFKYARSVMKRK